MDSLRACRQHLARSRTGRVYWRGDVHANEVSGNAAIWQSGRNLSTPVPNKRINRAGIMRRIRESVLQFFRRRLIRKRPVPVDVAIAAFLASPTQWFCSRGVPYEWPVVEPGTMAVVYFNNIRVLVENHPLGVVEGLYCYGRSAFVTRIAVGPQLTRRRIGTTLAQTLAEELTRRYGVNRIVFLQNHEPLVGADYPAFFAHLGAIAMELDAHSSRIDRPDYEWLKSGWALKVQ